MAIRKRRPPIWSDANFTGIRWTYISRLSRTDRAQNRISPNLSTVYFLFHGTPRVPRVCRRFRTIRGNLGDSFSRESSREANIFLLFLWKCSKIPFFFYYKILLREIEKIIYNAISFSNPLMRDSLLLIWSMNNNFFHSFSNDWNLLELSIASTFRSHELNKRNILVNSYF